jgi:hypothetical protein
MTALQILVVTLHTFVNRKDHLSFLITKNGTQNSSDWTANHDILLIPPTNLSPTTASHTSRSLTQKSVFESRNIDVVPSLLQFSKHWPRQNLLADAM